jgi:hypothetical protein
MVNFSLNQNLITGHTNGSHLVLAIPKLGQYSSHDLKTRQIVQFLNGKKRKMAAKMA